MERHDIIISGGGMVGLSLAVALAEAQFSVAVIEKTPYSTQCEKSFDGRVSAIAYGSKRMLERLGVWALLSGEASPIYDIRVSDGDSLSHLHYNYKEVGNDPFGYIVENRFIRHALTSRVRQLPALTIHAPDSITEITVEEGKAQVVLSSGKQLTAPLLVGAEGRNSKVREAAEIKTITANYHQTAIVCTIAHEYEHEGLAQERFLRDGPFAVLPMTGRRSSLVWVEPPTQADYMMRLPDTTFVAEIKKRVGGYLGNITLASDRFTYPLGVSHAKTYISKRVVLIGDAAHGIHPLAGQGLNLGFRDVAALAEVLVTHARLGLDIGSLTVLQKYQQWRRFDNLAMTAATDGLNRLFSTEFLPVTVARRLGLELVGKMPALKRYFIRNAMGDEGKIPPLMQPLSAA